MEGKQSKILGERYSGKSKPRILNLYTSLTTIEMVDNETVADCIIRAENIVSVLCDAGENMSDGMLVATVLNHHHHHQGPCSATGPSSCVEPIR